MIRRGLERLTEISGSVDTFLESIVGVGLFADAKEVRDAAISFLSFWLDKPVELVEMFKDGKTYGLFQVNGDRYQMGPYEPSVYKSEESLKLIGFFLEP